VGTSINDDYNPSKKEFNVPIVLREEMVQRGANFIEEVVPPRVVLSDGRVFVLTTHAAVDMYKLNKRGTGHFKANGHDIVHFPPHKHRQNTDVITYYLVTDMIVARRGLTEASTRLPAIMLQLRPDQPPVNHYVFSSEMVRAHKIQTSGKFEMPISNIHGPYPLLLDSVERGEKNGTTEAFSIPPPPNEFGTSPRVKENLNVIAHPAFYLPVIMFVVLLVMLAWAKYG
jgi:hypothetical protein